MKLCSMIWISGAQPSLVLESEVDLGESKLQYKDREMATVTRV